MCVYMYVCRLLNAYLVVLVTLTGCTCTYTHNIVFYITTNVHSYMYNVHVKSDCLGCAVFFAFLFVLHCLLLSSFLLISHYIVSSHSLTDLPPLLHMLPSPVSHLSSLSLSLSNPVGWKYR